VVTPSVEALMTKAARLLLLFVIGVLAYGTAQADAKYRIAYVARAQGDSFAAWLANAMVAEAKKYPDMSVTVFDGQSRNELIATHIENAVTNKFDLILIQPLDSEAQVAPAQAAVKAGVKVMTCNNRINDPSIPGIDADPIQQAAENAKLALKQVPKNAKVVVLMGPPGNMHSDKRRVGWQQVFFDKRPDVKIVGEQIANWNKDEAMQKMEDWIQATGGKIDAIISMNDNMAVGALEAVKGSGAKSYPLAYGVDGTPEACLYIKNGIMTSTTLQSAYALADKSMKMAHDLLTGKLKGPKMDFITADLITKDNADKFIQMHKEAGNMK
jgi:inositol transport system substrate-binding protein